MPKKLVGFRLDVEVSEQLKIYAIRHKTTVQKLLEEYVEKLLEIGESNEINLQTGG